MLTADAEMTACLSGFFAIFLARRKGAYFLNAANRVCHGFVKKLRKLA